MSEHVKEPSFSICPNANLCKLTTAGGPECGTTPEHTSPLLLAEHVCRRALEGSIRHEGNLPPLDNPLYETRRNMFHAWGEIEMGMSPKIDSWRSEEHFDDARLYAERVIDTSAATLANKLDAAILQLYIPVFMARRHGLEVDDEEIAKIKSTLAMLIDVTQRAPLHSHTTHPDHLTLPDHTACLRDEDERIGQLIKLGSQLLFIRNNRLLLPASYREAHASGRVNHTWHHDGYIIEDKAKIPIKIRAKNRGLHGKYNYDQYGKSLIVISYNAIVNQAHTDLHLERDKTEDKSEVSRSRVYQTVDWLRREGQGYTISPLQDNIIGLMGQDIDRRIQNFQIQYSYSS